MTRFFFLLVETDRAGAGINAHPTGKKSIVEIDSSMGVIVGLHCSTLQSGTIKSCSEIQVHSLDSSSPRASCRESAFLLISFDLGLMFPKLALLVAPPLSTFY